MDPTGKDGWKRHRALVFSYCPREMAAILLFQVSVGGLLSSDPQRLLMPIFMLVSANKHLYQFIAVVAILKNGRQLEISIASGNFLVK